MKRVNQTVTVSMKDSKEFCESFGFEQIELPSSPVDFGFADGAYAGVVPVGSFGTNVAAFVSFELSRIKFPDKVVSCKLAFDVGEYDGCSLSEFALYQAQSYSTENREKTASPQVIASGGQNRIVYDITDAVNKNPHGKNIFFVYYDRWEQWGGYVGFYMPNTSLEITAQIDVETDFDTATDFAEHDVRRICAAVGENVEYSVNIRTGRFDCVHTLASAGSNRTEFRLTAAFDPFFVSSSPRRNVLLNCDRFVYKDGDSYIFVDSDYRKHKFEKLSPSLYYDTAHTGLTLELSGGGYVISDGFADTLRFGSDGLLIESARTFGEAADCTRIVRSSPTSTVTDSMGRDFVLTQDQSSLRITCPDKSVASATFSGNNLIRATTPDGDTVTYSYKNVSGYMLISSVASSYGDKIEIGYDSSWRVKTLNRYVGENLCSVLLLSYNEGSTIVSSADYIASKPVGEIKTGYVFSDDGKLLSEFEINDETSLASALDANFISDTDYERYVYSLNPALCKKGELYAETESGTVGYFSVAAPDKQERYVLYARIDARSVFEDKKNGYVDIVVALNGLAGDVVASVSFRAGGGDVQVACCPADLEEFSFVEPLWFAVSGNANLNRINVEDISMCLVPLEGKADFIKSGAVTGMKITEYKKDGNSVWTKLDSCKAVGVSDCKKITEKDWKLIERNRVQSGKFVLWYNDLSKAMLADAETKIQCNGVEFSVGDVERAEVETEMAKRIFRTLHCVGDGSGGVNSTLTENVNVGTNSRVSIKYYDSYNRLYKSVDAEGVTTNYSYDERGRALQVCSDVDFKTIRTSRSYGNPSADGEYDDTVTDEYGVISSSQFDASNGILTAQTLASGQKIAYAYDGFYRPDKISASVDSLECKNAFAYNGENLPSALSSADTAYEFKYDGQKKISRIDVDSRSRLSVTRSTVVMGKSVALAYSNGGKITNSYDKYGNLVETTDAVSSKELMYCVYGDAYKNVSSITSPLRATSRGSLLRKKGYKNISEPYTEEYSYNGLGSVDKILRSDGYTESYAYDDLGRIKGENLVFKNYGTLISKSYSYFGCDAEENGALKSTDSDMNGMEITDSFARDKFRRITSRDISVYLPSYGFDYFGYNFVYDDYVENGKTYTGGRVKKFTAYFARDNAEGTDERSFEENYSYDESGNITSVNDTKYTYDKLGRLTREDNALDKKTYAYSYDADGNITGKKEYTLTYGALSSPIKTYNYSYDGDRLTQWNGRSFAYDGFGNPTSYKGYALSWTRGTLLQSYSLGGGRSVTFEYDGEGMRRSKTVKNGNIVESKTVYAYSGGKLIGEERTRNGKTTEIIYFYSNGELTGFMRDLSQYFYLKDGLGNITGVYDGGGNLCESYAYDAWGNCTVSQSGIDNAMRYKGYYFDEETKLYYLQTRYYDPELGRFVSPDSFEYLAPDTLNGLNLYAYCLNNPVMNTDPSGTFVSAILGFIFGGLWGGLGSVAQGGDFWEGAKEGAITGFLNGLAVDIGMSATVLSGGNLAVGFATMTIVSLAVNIVADITIQKITTDKIDVGRVAVVTLTNTAANMLSFGVSALMGNAVGQSTANLFETLLPKYTPWWSWLGQAILGWALPGATMFPSM